MRAVARLMRLSALDAGILRLLAEDARLSFRALAEHLDSTTPTVSARVKALEDLGILRGYRADVDPDVLGGTVHVVTVRARPRGAQGIADALARVPGVEEVLVLAGGTIQARVRVRPPDVTLADVHEALADSEDVTAYDAAEVLAVAHRTPSTIPEAGVDVPCHQCHGPIHGDPVRGKFAGRAHVFCCRQCHADFRARFEKATAGS